MFKRVLVEDWALCLPFVAFFLFFAIFALIAVCALKLGKSSRTRLASLPLDEQSPPSHPTPESDH
jgi:hypothetical protein